MAKVRRVVSVEDFFSPGLRIFEPATSWKGPLGRIQMMQVADSKPANYHVDIWLPDCGTRARRIEDSLSPFELTEEVQC